MRFCDDLLKETHDQGNNRLDNELKKCLRKKLGDSVEDCSEKFFHIFQRL